MKKKLKVVVLFLMIFSVLIPKSYGQLEKAIQLDYWVPFSGTDARPMQNLVNDFNESEVGIEVNMKLIEWDQYYSDLYTSLRSNYAPDIAIAHTSKLEELSSTKMLTDINAIAKETGMSWDEFSENTLNATIKDGKYLAIPLDTHALIMFYNKTLLKEAGLLDKNGKILMQPGVAGFMSFLKILKRKLPENTYPFVSATDNVYPFWIWYALYSQIEGGGAYIVNGKAAFNNSQARKALNVLIEMRDQGLWPKEVHDVKGYNMFKFGYAAISFHGVWATWNFEQNSKLRFGATTIPQLFDKPATWGDSHTFIIPKQKNKERQIAAIKFANWVTSHGSKWAVAGHIPSKKTVLRSKEYQNLKYRPDYVQAARQVNYYPRHAKLWRCNNKMVEIFALMMKGEISSEEAIIKAEQEINKILVE